MNTLEHIAHVHGQRLIHSIHKLALQDARGNKPSAHAFLPLIGECMQLGVQFDAIYSDLKERAVMSLLLEEVHQKWYVAANRAQAAMVQRIKENPHVWPLHLRPKPCSV